MKNSCCSPDASHPPSEGVAPLSAAQSASLSHSGMVRLEGGLFLMGAKGAGVWFADGEGPVRETVLSPFWLDAAAVSNSEFALFAQQTGYVTEAEKFGWSFVHASQLSESQRTASEESRVAGLEWWYGIERATWREPLGDGRNFEELARLDHPVVHVSWNDAAAYAHWAGKRLPTEAEWEFACRGGLVQMPYPWGDELTPNGEHRCNIWQGQFPVLDTGEDGFTGTAPTRSFLPNGHGFYNMTGNVWEWTADWFHPTYPRTAPRENPRGPETGTRRSMRGGSYLCHASYCNRYRCSARSSNTPDTSTGHLGFRCATDA